MQATTTLSIEELLADITPDKPKILYGVSWDDYVELSEATLDKTNFKISFNRGVLKIVGQGFNHDAVKLMELINRGQSEPQFEVLKDFQNWHEENK